MQDLIQNFFETYKKTILILESIRYRLDPAT